MPGPIIMDAKGSLQSALSGANDTATSFFDVQGQIEKNKGAKQEREQQAVLFDQQMQELARARAQREGDKAVDVQRYQEEARGTITRSMIARTLRKGFPTPPDPGLVRRMEDRFRVMRDASPEKRAEALRWMQESNQRDAVAGSARSMRMQLEDLQRIGAFGEDEETLGVIDGLKDDLQTALDLNDIREIRTRIDAIRGEIARIRGVHRRFAAGMGLIGKWTQDVGENDPRRTKLDDIASAWETGLIQDQDTLVDKLFEAKYDRSTARAAEQTRAKAVEMLMEASGGEIPTEDQVMGMLRLLREPEAAARADAAGPGPAAQGPPGAQPSLAGPGGPGKQPAPTKAFEDVKGDILSAMESGDAAKIAELSAQVGTLNPAQEAELRKGLAEILRKRKGQPEGTVIESAEDVVTPGDRSKKRATQGRQRKMEALKAENKGYNSPEAKARRQMGPDASQIQTYTKGNDYTAGPASLARAVAELHLSGRDDWAATLVQWAQGQPELKELAAELARGFRGEDWLEPLKRFWPDEEAFKKAYGAEKKRQRAKPQKSAPGQAQPDVAP